MDRKTKILGSIIIFLVLLLLGIVTYIIYDKTTMKIQNNYQQIASTYYQSGQNELIYKMNACGFDSNLNKIVCEIQNGVFPRAIVIPATNTTNASITTQYQSLVDLCGVNNG